MKIGIYVGSFNPVHIGHKDVMDYLLNNNYVDLIIVIPTGNYWNKIDLINVIDRINMLKIYENKKIIINTELNNLQYTYQILEELKNKYKESNLYLIIGDDNIVDFNKWEKVNCILKDKVIVICRNNINVEKYIDKFKEKDKFIIVKNYIPKNISSTLVRKLIKENNLQNILKYIDYKVLNYILEKKLYGVIDSARK